MLNESEIEERLVKGRPDRVWDGEQGLHPREAKEKGIEIKYCLVRKDGWMLGCTQEHLHSAEKLWADEWAMLYFLRDGNPGWTREKGLL